MKNYCLEHDCYPPQDKTAVRTSLILARRKVSQLLWSL